MGRLTATTNPTQLRKIDRKHIGISRFQVGENKKFQVTKLELADYSLAGDELVIAVARAGNTSQRFNIGTVGCWSNEALSLAGLDDSQVLRFRILVRKEDSPRLLASAEGIRCTGDGDIESMLPIVSTNLGQRLWSLVIADDGPVIQCNQAIFPNGESAQASVPFCTLVLPEALRQILDYLASHQELLTQDGGVWVDWSDWMTHLGIERPPADDELRKSWLAESVSTFCDHFRCAEQMGLYLISKVEP